MPEPRPRTTWVERMPAAFVCGLVSFVVLWLVYDLPAGILTGATTFLSATLLPTDWSPWRR